MLALSTLSEINALAVAHAYQMIQAVNPDRWTSSRKVIFAVSNDIDTALEHWLSLNNKVNIELPLGIVWREYVKAPPGRSQIPQRPWESDFYPTGDPESDTVVATTGRGARMLYHFMIYDERAEFTEQIIDYFYASGSAVGYEFSYTSKVLNDLVMPYRVDLSLPEYTFQPPTSEKLKGRGPLYILDIPMLFSAMLGTARVAKIIKTIYYDTYMNPYPGIEENKEEIIITADTVV